MSNRSIITNYYQDQQDNGVRHRLIKYDPSRREIAGGVNEAQIKASMEKGLMSPKQYQQIKQQQSTSNIA